MYVVKAAETTFVQKNCTFNVDEIDYRFVIFRQKKIGAKAAC